MNEIPIIALALVAWLLAALGAGMIGAALGRARGMAGTGFWLGFWLSAVGWILVLLLPGRWPSGPRKSGLPVVPHVGKVDPFILWDAREKAKTILPPPAKSMGTAVDPSISPGTDERV